MGAAWGMVRSSGFRGAPCVIYKPQGTINTEKGLRQSGYKLTKTKDTTFEDTSGAHKVEHSAV
uniref:Uncharacterized protein n=1 Tax=Oryza punctata TaxID=4537 RepID=A0A0E0L5M0_ORYPU